MLYHQSYSYSSRYGTVQHSQKLFHERFKPAKVESEMTTGVKEQPNSSEHTVYTHIHTRTLLLLRRLSAIDQRHCSVSVIEYSAEMLEL